MEMTRERISFTFDPRDTLLSLQRGFSFVRAVVACAILEKISGLEPSSETTAPRYLKLVTVPSFCSFTFVSLWLPLALFIISLVLSALISILYLVQFCRDFLLGFLAPALPQLEHLSHLYMCQYVYVNISETLIAVSSYICIAPCAGFVVSTVTIAKILEIKPQPFALVTTNINICESELHMGILFPKLSLYVTVKFFRSLIYHKPLPQHKNICFISIK